MLSVWNGKGKRGTCTGGWSAARRQSRCPVAPPLPAWSPPASCMPKRPYFFIIYSLFQSQASIDISQFCPHNPGLQSSPWPYTLSRPIMLRVCVALLLPSGFQDISNTLGDYSTECMPGVGLASWESCYPFRDTHNSPKMFVNSNVMSGHGRR